jgi:hypothetical protein
MEKVRFGLIGAGTSLDDGMRVSKVILAIMQSASNREPVKLVY